MIENCTIYEQRLYRLQEQMITQEIDCAVVCTSPNLFYMTGYAPKKDERFQVAFFPKEGEPVLALPKMYLEQAERECSITNLRPWNDGTDLTAYIRGIVEELGLSKARIAIDDTLEYRAFHLLRHSMAQAECIPGNSLFTPLRMRKSPEEIELMKQSGRMSDEIMRDTVAHLEQGMSEAEVKTWLEYELSLRGMRDGFSNLVVFGENTSNVHHVSGDRRLQDGDAVYLDLGGAYRHYWSDITRSLHVGKPTARYVEVYQRVREAQQLAFDAIRPGMRAGDVHLIAWNYLEKYDLARYFLHRLGHGIGLEGHELPNLSSDSDVILEPAMTFSCEPGVYFAGEFGIRIEDSCCVTENGAISFNEFTKELIIL